MTATACIELHAWPMQIARCASSASGWLKQQRAQGPIWAAGTEAEAVTRVRSCRCADPSAARTEKRHQYAVASYSVVAAPATEITAFVRSTEYGALAGYSTATAAIEPGPTGQPAHWYATYIVAGDPHTESLSRVGGSDSEAG
jgi:hypothetical protein